VLFTFLGLLLPSQQLKIYVNVSLKVYPTINTTDSFVSSFNGAESIKTAF